MNSYFCDNYEQIRETDKMLSRLGQGAFTGAWEFIVHRGGLNPCFSSKE